MLANSNARVKWNPKNKKKYTDAGYIFTKMGDEFEIDVNDLTRGSSAMVTVFCDYCGKEYELMWQTYVAMKKRSVIEKDCCGDCCQKKAAESVGAKYGGFKGMHDASDAKRSKTNIEKYGTYNVFGNREIIKKIQATNQERYGATYPQGSIEVLEKTKRTNLEKYGVEHYVELFRGKYIKENSPKWKGGPECSRVERATHEYRQWRASVFYRDNYTCAKCGARNGSGKSIEVNAHHINNWRDNPDKRYDIDNGITLCEECHNKFHSIYGKRNNNISQINEFLNIDEKVC